MKKLVGAAKAVAARLKRVESARSRIHKRRLKNDEAIVKAQRKLEALMLTNDSLTTTYNGLVYKATELKSQLSTWGY